jgi:hypothetical protein
MEVLEIVRVLVALLRLPLRCFVGEGSFEGAPTARQAIWLRGFGALGWVGLVIDVHWRFARPWKRMANQTSPKKIDVYSLAPNVVPQG